MLCFLLKWHGHGLKRKKMNFSLWHFSLPFASFWNGMDIHFERKQRISMFELLFEMAWTRTKEKKRISIHDILGYLLLHSEMAWTFTLREKKNFYLWASFWNGMDTDKSEKKKNFHSWHFRLYFASFWNGMDTDKIEKNEFYL